MRITFSDGGSSERRQAFRQWLIRNLVVDGMPYGPVRVDTVRRTITFSLVLDESQPGDLDFPELRRDIENNALTGERVVPLLVHPPATLVGERAIGLVA